MSKNLVQRFISLDLFVRNICSPAPATDAPDCACAAAFVSQFVCQHVITCKSWRPLIITALCVAALFSNNVIHCSSHVYVTQINTKLPLLEYKSKNLFVQCVMVELVRMFLGKTWAWWEIWFPSKHMLKFWFSLEFYGGWQPVHTFSTSMIL